MKLTALKTFRHGSRTFLRGSAVEMSEAQAKPLIGKKMVEEVKEAPKNQQTKSSKPPKSEE